MTSILNITEQITKDINIESYQFHEHKPESGTNLNNPSGEIRINIGVQDNYTHPSESFLLIEGNLVSSANGNPMYGIGDAISLTNNGIMYLFKNITLTIGSLDIESITYPGQATTMLGLLKYPADFSKTQGLNQLWVEDKTDKADVNNSGFEERRQYIIRDPDPPGSFSFRIPLKHIFGYCADYDKVIYGMRQSITLTRIVIWKRYLKVIDRLEETTLL